jgi:hypothetical protein
VIKGPIVGRAWLVRGYHTGDFVGRCESIGRDIAVFLVLDTMRPAPRIADRCCFPGCVLQDCHPSDHELARIRIGARVEVFWRNAQYVAAEDLAAVSLQRYGTLDLWTAPCSTPE